VNSLVDLMLLSSSGTVFHNKLSLYLMDLSLIYKYYCKNLAFYNAF